jgi:hypothetical protein
MAQDPVGFCDTAVRGRAPGFVYRRTELQQQHLVVFTPEGAIGLRLGR